MSSPCISCRIEVSGYFDEQREWQGTGIPIGPFGGCRQPICENCLKIIESVGMPWMSQDLVRSYIMEKRQLLEHESEVRQLKASLEISNEVSNRKNKVIKSLRKRVNANHSSFVRNAAKWHRQNQKIADLENELKTRPTVRISGWIEFIYLFLALLPMIIYLNQHRY